MQEEVRLGPRTIYILPTRHGLLFAFTLVALLLGAINYSNALAYLLTFLLASLGIVSLLHSQKNLLGLYLAAAGGEPVFAGEPATFRVFLRSDRSPRSALRVETKSVVTPVFDVPHRDTHCAALAVPAVQRGWLECPPLRLTSVYPLGVTRVWTRWFPLPARTLVYPKPADESVLANAPGIDGESGGALLEDGDDFAGLRSYQSGDPLSRISWKTLARGGGLHTKDFRAPRAESLWLDWEALAPHDTETRLRLLCRAVLDADTLGLAYGLRLPGAARQPDNGPTHRARCLEALALYEDRH